MKLLSLFVLSLGLADARVNVRGNKQKKGEPTWVVPRGTKVCFMFCFDTVSVPFLGYCAQLWPSLNSIAL
jgi:hypothetical protein